MRHCIPTRIMQKQSHTIIYIVINEICQLNTKPGGYTAIKHSRQGSMTILQIKYHMHVNALRVNFQMNLLWFFKIYHIQQVRKSDRWLYTVKTESELKTHVYSTKRVRLSTLDANSAMWNFIYAKYMKYKIANVKVIDNITLIALMLWNTWKYDIYKLTIVAKCIQGGCLPEYRENGQN